MHLGCLQKKGAFLEGLGELHLSELGGSLYGLQSIRSRWQLMRDLRETERCGGSCLRLLCEFDVDPSRKAGPGSQL